MKTADRILLILCTVFLYLAQGLVLLRIARTDAPRSGVPDGLLSAVALAAAALVVTCIALGFVRCGAGRPTAVIGEVLFVLVLKLALIPFFVLSFLMGAGVIMALMVVPGLQLLLLFAPLAAVIPFLVLLVTSSHAAAVLAEARRQQLLPAAETAVLTALQFLFVADVVAFAVCYRRLRLAAGAPNAPDGCAQNGSV